MMNGARLAAKPAITAPWAPRPGLRTNSIASPLTLFRICIDRRQRIVIRPIVANENARRRPHVLAQRAERRQNIAALIVNRDDDVEAVHH